MFYIRSCRYTPIGYYDLTDRSTGQFFVNSQQQKTLFIIQKKISKRRACDHHSTTLSILTLNKKENLILNCFFQI